MVFPPIMWVFLYLTQLLLLSLALGGWAVHQPRLLMVPRLSRFLIGFCITPFVLGMWMLFLSAILPGSPRLLFLLPPSVMAIVLLVLYGPRTLRRLVRDYQRTRRLSKNLWLVYLICACAALVLALVLYRLVINGQIPIIQHDALSHLARALLFANERSISSATAFFRDAPDGTFRGTHHGFSFPAYLSHALMTTGKNPLGYPYDHAAAVAFQMTFIYMLLSVVALAGTARILGTGALAMLLLLQVPQLEYIAYAQSRDAFRIIPLMLLAATLSGLSSPRLRLKLRPASLLPPLVLAAFCLEGHTIGGFVVVCIALAWLIWGLLQKARWLHLGLVLAAIGVGLFVSGFRYLDQYLETGKVLGDISGPGSVEGTSLEEIRLYPERYHITHESTLTERLGILLERDRYRLSVPGLLGAVLALVWWARFQRERRARSIPFTGLLVLAVSLPFIGLFDYQYPLSKAFVNNIRYALHWYPFAAVCIAMLVGYWYDRSVPRDNRYIRYLMTFDTGSVALSPSGVSSPAHQVTFKRRITFGYVKLLSWVALVVLVAVVTYSAHETIISKWRITTEARGKEWIAENIEPLQRAIRQMPPGQRLLMDDPRYNYYLDNQAMVMYSRPTWDVIQAKNESKVRDALGELNIGAVVLEEENISGWWDQIPLFSFLDNFDNAVLVFGKSFRVYRIFENEWERRSLVVDALLENAVNDMPMSHVLELMEVYSDVLESRSFPFSWQGPDTISMQDLPQTAPPLIVQGYRGDFTFSRTSVENGDVIRVSPVLTGANGNERIIQFGCWFKDKEGDGFEIRPGQVVVLSLWARLSAPPERAEILIQDKTETWQCNRASMGSTLWQQYAVVRKIRAEATEVIIAVSWEPKTGQEWLEIKDMRIFTQSEEQP